MQFFLLAGFAVVTAGLSGAMVRDQYVEAELIAEDLTWQPGGTHTIGLRLKHDPGWHTYWIASATGYATSLNWDLPEGITAGEPQWPVPQVYEMGGYIEFVYENEVLIPIQLHVDEDFAPDQAIQISALVGWLMCTDTTCVPGEVELSLTIPVSAGSAVADSNWQSAFAATRAQLPQQSTSISLQAYREGDQVWLWRDAPAGESVPERMYFFDLQTFIEPTLEQEVRNLENKWVLSLKVDPAGVQQADGMKGVLYSSSGWGADGANPALAVDIEWSDAPPPMPAAALSSSSNTAPAGSLFTLLGLAFVGGLILNLMPCVFPVIGIKIMGFVKQSGQARGKVVLHGLTFSVGVLIAFWILAIVLIIVRQGGQELGWGFQLQSAAFVYLLTLLLFVFGLNMSGLFEVGQSAVGVGHDLTGKSGFAGSFFSGMLATIVATPCAAPFLAPALGVALTLPAFESLVVFTAIALGLAAPYLTLSAFPRLIDMLPRPGAWMESFKQFMSFLLYATVAYLLWVLAGQLNDLTLYSSFALLAVYISLVVIAMAVWTYGRWGAAYKKPTTRRFAYAGSLLLLAAGLFMGYPKPIAQANPDLPSVVWEKWEPGKAEQLAADGKIVYVDFTARWCVTCQTNKAAVFSSDSVLQLFHSKGVVALQADWTNRDDAITRALAEFNRSAVPFNLLYGPGLNAPVILPELLTPGIVINRIESLANP